MLKVKTVKSILTLYKRVLINPILHGECSPFVFFVIVLLGKKIFILNQLDFESSLLQITL